MVEERWHGTAGGYTNHKCRCEWCTVAFRESMSAYRKRPAADKKLTHGTQSSYAAGCRCRECKMAHTKYYQRRGAVADPREEPMRKLAEQGWTLQKIADKYNLSRQRVSQIVGKIGPRRPAHDIVKQNLPLIKKLWSKGVSYRQIGRQIGVSSPTLAKKLDRPSKFHGTLVHGTRNGYVSYGCRCDLCRQSNKQYAAERYEGLRKQKLCVTCRTPSLEHSHCPACAAKRKTHD